jgi:hypothetical protein
MDALPPATCVSQLLAQAERLGVAVRWQAQVGPEPEAAYQAPPGQPGLLLIQAGQPAPINATLCRLLSHEMVHVLQHWHGQLQAITPLGWPTGGTPPGRQLSLHEAEAFTAQGDPPRVLEALKQLKAPAHEP